jgi:gliding motility-associated-like protein
MGQLSNRSSGAAVSAVANTTIRSLLLAMCLLLVSAGEVFATHAMGGDLTYECLGNDQYKVRLNFFRDCNGVAAPTTCNNGRRFRIRSTACGADFTACFNLDSVQVITPICATAPDRCNDPSGTYGVERYVFSATIDLSAWAGCGTDWVIDWELCCRNNAITSLVNPGSRNLYLSATLDNTLTPCNSSPRFLNDPVPFGCVGQQIVYNHGVSDLFGDSLSFELAPALGNNGNNIPYSNGYSYLEPVITAGGANAVQIDPLTGTITCTPSIQQFSVVTVRVNEYRNGVLIGTYIRDLQFAILPCSNNLPTVSGINGTNDFVYDVCVGESFCFTINSNDLDPTQQLTLSWNNAIPGATFTSTNALNPVGTFCWTPTTVGSQLFTVTAMDDACILNGSATQGYLINVTPAFEATTAGADQSVCATSATLGAQPAPGTLIGTWSIINGSGTFTDPNSPFTTVNGLSPGVNTFQWSVDFETCGDATDQVVITSFSPSQPAANAGPAQSLCLPSSSTTLAANAAVAPATGTWSLISGSGTFADPSSPATLVSGLALGVNVFRWTINNGPCGQPTSSEVTITLYSDEQSSANAGPDRSICLPVAPNSVTLEANNIISPATGQWTMISGSATIVSPNSSTTVINDLTVGVHEFQWTVDNGACANGITTDIVQVFVHDATIPDADAGPDQSLCSTSGTTVMAASVAPVPSIGQWTLVNGTGTIADPNDPATAVTGLAVGHNILQWTVSNGPCGTTSDQVSIFVYDPNNPTANAGPDQGICTDVTNSIQLQGSNVIFPATGLWTVSGGPATILDPTSPITSVTDLTTGSYTFIWTVNNGVCPNPISASTLQVVVANGEAQPAEAGPDQSICGTTAPVTMAANAAEAPATGFWTVAQGTANFGNPASPTTSVTGLSVGVNILQWNIDNLECGITFDQVMIVVFDPAQPAANAGPDQTLCTTSTTTDLEGSAVIAPALGQWTLISGAGIIANPASPTTTVSGLGFGPNVFQWSVNNGVCANAMTTDQVTITVFDPNSANAFAGTDQSICTPASSVVMTANTPTFPASGTWSVVSGNGTIMNASDPNTSITALPVGVNVFQWTTTNGNCPNGNGVDQVTINVFDANAPVANAGPDQQLCTSTLATATLAGSALIGPATGSWTLISGSGIISNPNSPGSAVIDLAVGLNIFQWTVSNGPCANGITTDQVSIYVFDGNSSVANAGADQDLCTPVGQVQLQGNIPVFPATGSWTLIGGAGVLSDPSDPDATLTGVTPGTIIMQWTVNNGPCANPITTDQVTINIFDSTNPIANAGPDQELCSPENNTFLQGSAVTSPAIGTWQLISGSGQITDVNDPLSAITDLGIGENILTWTVNNGVCADPITVDQVSIFVFDVNNPIADAGPDQIVCTPLTSASLSGSNVIFPASGSWSLISGQGTITDPASPQTTVTGLGVGENIFEWTVDNGACAPGVTFDQVSIFLIDANEPPADAGPDQELCFPLDQATLGATPPVGVQSGTWTLVQGTGSFADANDPTTEVTGLSIGQNTFLWTLESGSCITTMDEVSIYVFDPNNPVANAGPNQELCMPQDSVFMAGSSLIFPATGTWVLLSGAGVPVDAGDPTTMINGLAVGANVFQWQVSNGPCPNGLTTNNVVITLYSDTTAAANAGPDLQSCLPITEVQLQGEVPPAPASGTWTVIAGTGIFTDPNSATTIVTGLSQGVNTFVWTLEWYPCPNNGILTDTVNVLVYDPLAPIADAGPDQELCGPGIPTVMAANVPATPGIGTWSVVQGSATIASENDPFTQVNDLEVGEHILLWTIFNGICGFGPPSVDTVRVTIYDGDAAAASAGGDMSECSPFVDVPLQGNDPVFPATGAWSVTIGNAIIDDITAAMTQAHGIEVGETVFQWTIDNGPCGSSSDDMQVMLFDSGLAEADAGPDQELCTPNTTTDLAGNAAVFPATGTWTLISGSGTINDPSMYNTSVSGLGIGTNVFEWTVANGPCGATGDQMVITVYDSDQPAANAGPDQQMCSPVGSVQLQGNNATFPATGSWSVISGNATINDPASATSSISGLGTGTTVLQWTVSNGPCGEPTTDQITITVFDGTIAPAAAGPDQAFCTPIDGEVTMLASSPGGSATGTWSVVSGNASLSSSTDPFSQVSGLQPGNHTFLWSVDNGSCGSSSDEVSIMVFDHLAGPASAGPDQEICAHQANTQLTADPAESTSFGFWSILQGGGDLVDPSDPNTMINNVPMGVNILAWTVNNGECGITVDTLLLNVRDCLSIRIPDAYSPNGDGINDVFFIENIDNYPNNKFTVFNRWGNKVFEASPYTNTWDGRSQFGVVYGEILPESTYYYVLELDDDSDDHNGSIFLRR